ncbi:MAG: DUF6183 family protein [Acidimicrobiia bacterium]|nr:DUF6183 family protein [Acidimicrobiia bacterium]
MERDGWLREVVERGDLDELVRVVDGLCDTREWSDLLALRDRCLRAVERGKQLWPAAHLAEYRLALEAPAPLAGAMLVEGAGRFTLGPISEVAASTHTWAELAPHAPPGPVAALAAHERVVRGEDLGAEPPVPPVLDLPGRLQDWEPRYALATYRPHTADFPTPELPRLEPVELPPPGERITDPFGCQALVDLAVAWTSESNGRAEAVAVRGDALAAVAALGVPRARAARLLPAEALASMAWTAASGGAHGRRRGAATGRFDAWFAVAALGGVADDWPLAPDAVGAALERLAWYAWDAREPLTGWNLHLAAEDRRTGRAWAVAAVDAR